MISQMLFKENLVAGALVTMLGFVVLYAAIWLMVLAPGAKEKAQRLSLLPLDEEKHGKQ